MPSHTWFKPLTLISALALIASGANAAITPPKTPPKIFWQACTEFTNPDLLCGTLEVPLVHNALGGAPGKINIALIKLPATATGKRKIGSLFYNPGGPGGSGVSAIGEVGEFMFDAAVRSQFDIIGFDPRGIGRSNGLTCDLTREDIQANVPNFPYPRTDAEINQQLNAGRYFASRCKEQGSAIIRSMTTADVARDLDLLRQAVGDKRLNFVGHSYGSYLGVTYANLFPQNVGRMVVDGVLDPVAWATGIGSQSWVLPVTTRLKSDKGTNATLQEFFRLCDLAGPGCAFSGGAAEKYKAIQARLRAEPLVIPISDTQSITVDDRVLASALLGGLYNSLQWDAVAGLLVAVDEQVSAEAVAFAYNAYQAEIQPPADETPTFAAEDAGFFEFHGVLCSDSTNPADPSAWISSALPADRAGNLFSASWTWLSSQCAHWPNREAPSRYTGPFNKRTANTVLVASTVYDPATDYSGAQAVRQLLPNSRLLTLAGWGHTTTGLSSCADAVINSYLLTGVAPARNTLCYQDQLPFNLPANSDPFASMSAKRADFGVAAPATLAAPRMDQRAVQDDKKSLRKRLLREASPGRHIF
jgi:pimeloyl-ACP methyl ester carboxylesterase